MRRIFSLLVTIFSLASGFAQADFIGIAKYRLYVEGGTDHNTDSMAVVFDSTRVAIILYLPDSNRTVQKIFIDDFREQKSYVVDPDKHSYRVDSMRSNMGYNFINDNSIGAINNELCMRYRADPKSLDKTLISKAECLGAINYRKVFIGNYSFLGVQPIVVDNRIVMDFTVFRTDGTKPVVTLSSIHSLESVEGYFDVWGYHEIH